MPPLETADLVPDGAVYWEKAGDDRYGRPALRPPVRVPARIVLGRRDVLDAAGDVVTFDGSAASDRELVVGSLLSPGDLLDLSADGDAPPEVYQVVGRKTARDVLGRAARYEFDLARYADALPADAVDWAS